MDEKPAPPPTRFNAVGFCLTAVRIWQWSSSFFVYGSFSLLYEHIRENRLGENDRMRGVQILGLVSLAYSTIVVCCVHVLKTLGLRTWRIFAIMSVPADLTIMGISLAKITILSYSGLPADCHGLTRDNYDGSDLVRQPAAGFTTIRFGSMTNGVAGELDGLCTFPRTVYGLSVVAIFSYTFSILLSALYLQQHGTCAAAADDEKLGHAGVRAGGRGGYYGPPRSPSPGPSVRSGAAAPSYHSRAPRGQSPRWAWAPPPLQDDLSHSSGGGGGGGVSSGSRSRSASPAARASRCSSWDATTLASRDGDGDSIRSGISLPDTDSVASGGSLPPPPLPGSAAAQPPPRRWSTSTSSSFDAGAFVVTDGFRPPGAGQDHPPGYSSRPGSLYHETVKYDAGLGLPGGPAP